MTTTLNPRINVTLGPDEFAAIQAYAASIKTSLSGALLRLAIEKLEDLEDSILGAKCLERQKSDTPSVRFSMEDFEKAFDALPE
jgi:hypothetical protein